MNQVTKAKIGIFALTMLAMSTLAITPSLSLIMAAFPESSANDVQQLTAIPSLMGIASAVFFSAFAGKIPHKALALAAPALIAVGGLLPAFVNAGLPFLLFCSGILGLGVGLVTNTANTLITDLIPADQQESVMAKNVIFVGVGSVVMTNGGSMLSAYGWQCNYLVYGLAVLVLVAVLALIPFKVANEAPAAAAVSDNAPAGGKAPLGVVAVVAAVVIMLYNGVYSAYPNNLTMILLATGAADASMTGAIMAVGTITGMVAGAVMDVMLKAIRKFSLAFGLALMAAGILIIGFATNLPMFIIGSALMGFALTFGFSQCPFIIAIGTNPAAIPTAMGLFSAGASIGGFVSPTILNALSGAFMGGSAQGCCIIAGVIAAVAAVVLLATRFQAGVIDRAFGAQAGAQVAGQVQGN